MSLRWAFRVLFRPEGVNKAEIGAIDKELNYFVANNYDKIYRGTVKRLPPRLSAFVILLEIVPLLWACGPAWVFWKFPMERKIGRLGKLIGSAQKPRASLVGNVTRN